MKHPARQGSSRRGSREPLLRLASAFLLIFALGACDTLDRALQVEVPSDIPSNVLDDPQTAPVLVAGVVADFDCALGSYIVNGGMLGNELVDGTFTVNRWPVDSRSLGPADSRYATFNCENLGVYTPLATARWSADTTTAKLEGWTDQQVSNRSRLIATAAAYAGYAHVLFGEGFCSAAFDLGPELTPQQVFQRAEERFTRAIAAAQAASAAAPTGTAGAAERARADTLLNMARVGRARTRLNLGRGAEAAADARLVPVGFVKASITGADPDRRRNRVAEEMRVRFISVAPAFRDLMVDSVADSRVAAINQNRTASDAQTPFWITGKYPTTSTPVPIASWDEAQLIIAEVEGGQTAVDIINNLRTRAGLPATFVSVDEAEIRDQVIEERRRELFLESHHLNDLRRFDKPFLPAAGTPYPKGGTYGTANCFPLPDVERNANPNI